MHAQNKRHFWLTFQTFFQHVKYCIYNKEDNNDDEKTMNENE